MIRQPTALMNSAAIVALGMPFCCRNPGCCSRVLYTSKTCARFGTLSAAQPRHLSGSTDNKLRQRLHTHEGRSSRLHIP